MAQRDLSRYSDEELDAIERQMAGQQAPTRPVVTPLPQNPYEANRNQRTDARADRGEQREDFRVGVTARGEQRDASKTAYDQTLKLRDDYDAMPGVKEYRVAAPQFVTGLRTTPDAAGDNALIYAYAKVMDPGSVVRESEMTMAGSASPWLEGTVAKMKKELGIAGGGQLPPSIREGLRKQMLTKVQELNRAYNAQRLRYKADAEAFGIDPQRVIGPHDGTPFLPEIEKRIGPQARNAMTQDTTGTGLAPGLAGGGDDQQSIPIPPEMQAEHEQYVTSQRGALDPNKYAAFRDELDQKYGFAPNTPAQLEENRNWATETNQTASKGGRLNLRLGAPTAELDGIKSLNASLFNNPLGAAALAAPPLAGGMDEASAFVRSTALGTDYATERDRMDAMRQAAQREYPMASLGGQVGGGMLGGAALLRGAPAATAAATSTVPRMLGTSAAIGGAQGAMEDNQNRLRGGLIGSGAGVAGGAAGRYAVAPALEAMARSRPVTAGINKAAQAINRLPGANVRPYRPPQLSAGESMVAGAQPDFPKIRSNIKDAADLGLPYALADADPKLRALAGTVTRKSVNARDLAEKTFEPRGLGQADRAVKGIGKYLAPITDVKARGKELIQAGNTASSPYYALAKGQAAPVSDEVAAILQTPAGKDALRRAVEIAQNEGRDPKSIGFDLDEQGEIVLRKLPSFETLDLVKRGLDARLDEARDAFGNIDLQGNPQLQAIEGLRQRFVASLDKVNENYPKARAEYAKYAQRKDALDQGYSAPSTKLRPRDLKRLTGKMDPPRLSEFQRGYATNLGDQAEAARMTSDPFQTIYGSPAQKAKIASLYPEGAPKFDRAYQLERDMAKTRHETLGGSPTAGRLQADQQLGEGLRDTATNVAIDVGTGSPGVATGLGALRSLARNKFGDGVAERRAEELAPRLFDTENPVDILKYLDDLARKNAEIDFRKRRAAQAGGLLGSFAVPSAVTTRTR